MKSHRPWPPPRGPWLMFQRWHDLLFAHWPVPAADLRPHIPAALQIDTFDGLAWLGVVPFRISGIRPQFTPPLPGLSAFPELNVRTYVTDGAKAGVWFFSLDAASAAAVRGARLAYHLPYFDARMSAQASGSEIDYACFRVHRGSAPAEFLGRYGPVGPVALAQPGTLDHWLTERYCLYSADRRGRLYRAEIDHPPWPLQPAEADIEVNTMAAGDGLRLPAEIPPRLHFARRLDVRVWPIQRLSSTVT